MEGVDPILQDDDLYLSLLTNEQGILPSDYNFADQLQLQEILLLAYMPSNSSPTNRSLIVEATTEMGESSSSSEFYCEICAEYKPLADIFVNKNCPHLYCKHCIGHHIAAKLQENISELRCPSVSCTGKLEPEQCRDVIPEEVFERWGNALCEAAILGWKTLHCPFRDCSALLVDDSGKEVVQSECMSCHRLFCARCNSPWHIGLACEEYRSLGQNEREREDLMLMELARAKRWKRCPSCSFFVEKNEGCVHMTCRYIQTSFPCNL